MHPTSMSPPTIVPHDPSMSAVYLRSVGPPQSDPVPLKRRAHAGEGLYLMLPLQHSPPSLRTPGDHCGTGLVPS